MRHVISASRHGPAILLLTTGLALSACLDGTEPLRPASIEVTNDVSAPVAGTTLDSPPSFLVLDQNGDPMSDVAVTVTVVAGGGTLVNPATRSVAGGTPVGAMWTLGETAGRNEVRVEVGGLEPESIVVTTMAGPPALFVRTNPSALASEVGTLVSPAPSVRLTDRFGNPIADARVSVEVSAGAADSVATTDADGQVVIADWVLGETSGAQTLTLSAGDAVTTLTVEALPGPPASIVLLSGANQSARAGSPLPEPIRISIVDRFGNSVPGVRVAFSVVEGGGFLRNASTTTDGEGIADSPGWALGLSALPQRLRAAADDLALEIAATVATDYDIDVRFFGPTLTPARAAAFQAAAARIRGAVVGNLAPVDVTGIDPADCSVTGASILSGTVDDIVIYASVGPIDDVGKVLASAGPCYVRTGGLPIIGTMRFDEADIGTLEARGTLVDVIIHEMLHTLGVGIGRYWNPHLLGRETADVAFTGPGALDGCLDSGGQGVCTSSVPVANTGGAGTRDSHWRESTFDSELMTGFSEVGAMPFSRITIGSLADIGYQVNLLAADDYAVPGFAGSSLAPGGSAPEGFDAVLEPRFEIDRSAADGRVRRIADPAFEP